MSSGSFFFLMRICLHKIFAPFEFNTRFCLLRFCMVYSEVPNFSEPNPELLSQTNQQNKSVSSHAPTTALKTHGSDCSQNKSNLYPSLPISLYNIKALLHTSLSLSLYFHLYMLSGDFACLIVVHSGGSVLKSNRLYYINRVNQTRIRGETLHPIRIQVHLLHQVSRFSFIQITISFLTYRKLLNV